jgi:nucleotide-binding universal stress UspA family protein
VGVIVVGVDHSEGAKVALRFALEEAKLRQAKLHAVHAWQFSGYVSSPAISNSTRGFDAALDEHRRAAEAKLEATLREAIPDAGKVEIEHRVVEGAPGAVLVEESRGADLLVVGSRGHGGFTGLLLGSVSQKCAHHAACPVVIVREKATGQ